MPCVAPEFNKAGCLLISEVKYLLENRDKDAPDTAYVPLLPLHPCGCLTYSIVCIRRRLSTSSSLRSSQPPILLEQFESESHFLASLRCGRLKSCDLLLRTLRREPALTQFETAQIANLCPSDAEEAKSIIPRCASQYQSRHSYIHC